MNYCICRPCPQAPTVGWHGGQAFAFFRLRHMDATERLNPLQIA